MQAEWVGAAQESMSAWAARGSPLVTGPRSLPGHPGPPRQELTISLAVSPHHCPRTTIRPIQPPHLMDNQTQPAAVLSHT